VRRVKTKQPHDPFPACNSDVLVSSPSLLLPSSTASASPSLTSNPALIAASTGIAHLQDSIPIRPAVDRRFLLAQVSLGLSALRVRSGLREIQHPELLFLLEPLFGIVFIIITIAPTPLSRWA
jgi:hypothetical protein